MDRLVVLVVAGEYIALRMIEQVTDDVQALQFASDDQRRLLTFGDDVRAREIDVA